MTDNFILGLIAESIARIEEQASKRGLSLNEYLRRQLDAIAGSPPDADPRASPDDLRRASQTARDLDDPKTMSAAWSSDYG